MAELVDLISARQLSGLQAKAVLDIMIHGDTRAPHAIAAERGMVQLSDDAMLRAACSAVLAQHAENVKRYRAGKTGLLGLFVASVVKTTGRRLACILTRYFVLNHRFYIVSQSQYQSLSFSQSLPPPSLVVY